MAQSVFLCHKFFFKTRHIFFFGKQKVSISISIENTNQRERKVTKDKLITRRPSKTMAQQQSSKKSGRGGRGGGQSRPASRQLVDNNASRQLVDAGNPNQLVQMLSALDLGRGNTTVRIVKSDEVKEKTRHEVVQAADICFLLDVSGSASTKYEMHPALAISSIFCRCNSS